jgi:PAS domain S-box-containing protein
MEHSCPSREVFRTGKPVNVIHSHFDKNGEKVYTEINAHPIKDEKGKIIHAVEIMRDITEKKIMEANLLKQEKLSVLIEMAGATAHELNQPLSVILPRIEMLLDKIDSKDSIFRELNIINKESIRMAALIKKIGEITTYQTKPYVENVKIIDIDQSSQISAPPEAPQNSQALMDSLLTTLNNYSTIITDLDGTIRYFNKSSEDLLGYAAEEVVNKRDVLLFSKFEEATPEKGITECRAPALNKGYAERKKTVITKSGKEVKIDLCFAPLKDKESHIAGFVGIARDTMH